MENHKILHPSADVLRVDGTTRLEPELFEMILAEHNNRLTKMESRANVLTVVYILSLVVSIIALVAILCSQ